MSGSRRRGPAAARAAPARRAAARPDPARRAALDLLRAVTDRDAYANLVLPGLLRARGLAGRDAAFATELGYGSLRSRGVLDAVLGHCVDRPVNRVDPPVLDVLRLGAYQLLFTRVPPHAAVATSTDLGRAVGGGGPARFVNAVLRRVAARSWADWLTTVAPAYADDPVGHLAVRHAHPRWVVEAFRDALHGDLAETAAALAADDVRPVVHLAARPGRLARDDLLTEAGPAAEPGPYSPYAVRLPTGGGDPGALPAVRAGRAGVQDEGSQLAAVTLANAPVAGPDRSWLDLCAGPGGKAALLAGLATGRGAALLAVDRAPHRARLVADAVGDAVRTLTVIADGTRPAWRSGAFDRVLVDAPCTGLGALRRRPEARWRRQPADVAGLRPLQRDLLAAALTATRPGGVVLYVVCSPHLAETRVPVDDLLRGRTDVEAVDVRPLLPTVPYLGDGPAVQLWPHRHGTDAMFLALLRRLPT